MDLGPKSLIQWICRECVRKLGSNELGNNYNGSRSQEKKDGLVLSKENCHRHSPRRSILVYISFWIWLQVLFLFLLCFSPNSSIFVLKGLFPFYTILPLSFLPSTCRPSGWLWFLSHQHLPEVSINNCKANYHYSGITSTLM